MTAIAMIHEENGVFGVSFPDFPGCITGADTLEEAICKAGEALAFHIVGMSEDGDGVPVLRNANEMLEDPDIAHAIDAGATLVIVEFASD